MGYFSGFQKNFQIIFVFFSITLLPVSYSLAQSNKGNNHSSVDSLSSDQNHRKKPVGQMDLKDIKKMLFHTRHHLKEEPAIDSSLISTIYTSPILRFDSAKLKPFKLYPSYAPAPGYNIQNGLLLIVACNFSFLTGNNENTNISTISFNPDYSLTYGQVMLPIVFNLWSDENKLDIIGDWRYYYYPTYTYGLGGNSSLANWDLINYSYIRFYQEVLKQIPGTKFYLGAGYDMDYHFDIKKLDSAGRGTDFTQYNGNLKSTVSSGPVVDLRYDDRKNQNNPIENALYSSLVYRYNTTLLGSTRNYQSVVWDTRKYIKFSQHSDNMLCFWNLNWFTFGGKAPYFDLPSTGWDSYSNTGRGYIQGRLRGPGMIYLESEYRFGITRNGLLGGVLFINGERVSDPVTYKFGTVLPGYGFGLRIKVNKFSRVNFAIDYGFGTQGSNGPAFNVSEIF
jgi:hypothetical protein